MHVIRRRGWEIAERLATPEHLFFDRRAFVPLQAPEGAVEVNVGGVDEFEAHGVNRMLPG